MTAPHPVSIVIVGIAVFLLGFLYDARFAGLPYQDPTPEMQANWLFHGKVAGRIMWAGTVILLAGCVWGGLGWAWALAKRWRRD